MTRETAADFHPEVLKLFDQYVHGAIPRREFLKAAGKYAVAGATSTASFMRGKCYHSPRTSWAHNHPD